ncbi:hypothetical protein EX30DRAFT_353298 [Ascodesmis nigricans]|uniref:MARVEL domain-containing protein n=1 Tax=Ascodesmis nigricans TaxID=341454 RepID=A0A4S2N7J0_9PEZI|nr:hypothetical protein EX30DRAFT_353298 [Ascodesmis nigricans]
MVRREGVPAYRWPETLLSLFLFILFVCSAITLGAFCYFKYVQQRLLVDVPWYYDFLIATSSITIAFILLILILYYRLLLLPILVLPIAFLLFVFWLIGLIKASIELWGPVGSINDNCQRYVYNEEFWGGKSLHTVARIQQEGMCNLWKTSFAMELIATFVLMSILVLAGHVMMEARRGYDDVPPSSVI